MSPSNVFLLSIATEYLHLEEKKLDSTVLPKFCCNERAGKLCATPSKEQQQFFCGAADFGANGCFHRFRGIQNQGLGRFTLCPMILSTLRSSRPWEVLHKTNRWLF